MAIPGASVNTKLPPSTLGAGLFMLDMLWPLKRRGGFYSWMFAVSLLKTDMFLVLMQSTPLPACPVHNGC